MIARAMRATKRTAPIREPPSRITGTGSSDRNCPVRASIALPGGLASLSTLAGAETAIALQRIVGNRAMVKSLAPQLRQVARCAGACTCGGSCKDEETFEEQQRQLRQAVAARAHRAADDRSVAGVRDHEPVRRARSQRRLERAAEDCTADGGRLNAQVFVRGDGTPEPKLEEVYQDRGRLVLGTHDSTPDGPVRRVQRALICAGYGRELGPSQDDGKYGPLTNAALKKFKRDHDLQPAYFDDVGPKTMHCLNKLAASCDQPAPPPTPTPPGPDPSPPGTCGPGTDNPFCLPPDIFPPEGACCKPFGNRDHALSVWASLSNTLPIELATASACGEVKDVWEAYFDAKSKPFAFDEAAGSCVAESAKRDTGFRGSNAANDHARAVDFVFALIMAFLPANLMGVSPPPFPLGGPLATLRLSLAEAVGPDAEPDLHVDITYGNAPLNAAGQLAGGTGRNGNGSDIFGDDDRVMGGPVVVDVTSIDRASGAVSGEIRWQPNVHVKDTVDFCPGNLGSKAAQTITLPMSKLEAGGFTRDVPIAIDYRLDVQTRKFNGVVPLAVRPAAPPPLRKPEDPDAHPCK
jgi:peptidoglycan hydrolase-like protein with peptidoglycan-binding domain